LVIASVLPAYEVYLDSISVPQQKFGLVFLVCCGFFIVSGFFSEEEALQNQMYFERLV